jgi:hypothetical protein
VRQIQAIIDSRLLYVGKATGRQYEWTKAGDIISVDENDAPELLAKRIGERSCCGEGLLGNKVFEEVMEE